MSLAQRDLECVGTKGSARISVFTHKIYGNKHLAIELMTPLSFFFALSLSPLRSSGRHSCLFFFPSSQAWESKAILEIWIFRTKRECPIVTILTRGIWILFSKTNEPKGTN